MDLEALVESLMDEVYHAAILNEDPVVQERIVKSTAYNLIEDFVNDLAEENPCPFCENLEEEIIELKSKLAKVEA